jgi:hypothetical protein
MPTCDRPAWALRHLTALLTIACAPVRVGEPSPARLALPAGCAGAVFCDDFESYPLGGPPGGLWGVSGSGGGGESALVDAGKAWSGGRSVRIRHTGTAHSAIYITLATPVLPLPRNDLHGRLMLFIRQAPPRLHWDNVRATGPRPDGKEAQYNLGGESASFLVNYEPHDCYRRTQVAYPQGRWACLQWQFSGASTEGGGTRNEVHVWLDGQPVEEATVTRFGQGCVDKTTSEWIAPRFERLFVGWEQYRPSDPIEMWIDDVAVGETPIACPASDLGGPAR